MPHTPGPWAAQMGEQAWEVNSNPPDPKPWAAVAMVPANNLGAREVDDDEAKANARLIAAAPDMLAACQDAVLFLQKQGYDKRYCEDHHIGLLDMLNSAISKAKGA